MLDRAKQVDTGRARLGRSRGHRNPLRRHLDLGVGRGRDDRELRACRLVVAVLALAVLSREEASEARAEPSLGLEHDPGLLRESVLANSAES